MALKFIVLCQNKFQRASIFLDFFVLLRNEVKIFLDKTLYGFSTS